MELVLAIRNQRIAILIFTEQAVPAAIVPAARTLAKIAADSPHVADLRAGDPVRRRGQRREAFANFGILQKLVDSNRRADAKARLRILDPAQFLDVLDVDHALRRGQVFLHQADEIGAAGENVRLAPARAEQTHRLLYCSWIGVFEGLHYAFLLSRAASTRSAVRGRWETRTPIALATALPIAVGSAIAAGSPKPITPRLSNSGSMLM